MRCIAGSRVAACRAHAWFGHGEAGAVMQSRDRGLALDSIWTSGEGVEGVVWGIGGGWGWWCGCFEVGVMVGKGLEVVL